MKCRALSLTIGAVITTGLMMSAEASVSRADDPRLKLDAYLDQRWDAPPGATDDLIKVLKLDANGIEQLLRGGRASYPDPPQARGTLTGGLTLASGK